MNKKLVKALEIITTEAEVSVLGDDNSDPHVQKVLDALEYVSKELCLDDTVTTYCRQSLDTMMTLRLGMNVKATNAQWKQVSDSIYDDDEAWSYVDEAIARAEDELIDSLVDEMGKPEPSPKFKAWDYVHHLKNKNEDLEPRLHIFGTVIKQENNNVWLTDDNDTCEIIRVFADELELAESPEDNVQYEFMFPSSSALEWEREAVQTLSLYPHSSSDEQAIMWRSFRRKAVKEGHKVYRRFMKTDHYHYYIPDLYVFCSENYS